MTTQSGRPQPLGATPTATGVQFALFSRHATSVTLCLFEAAGDSAPSAEIELGSSNRTGDIWHIWVEGLLAGQLYLFRVDGPFEPALGHRYDASCYLADPYAKAFTGGFEWAYHSQVHREPALPNLLGFESSRAASEQPAAREDRSRSTVAKPLRSAAAIPKCIVVDDAFDWQGDRPLNYPLRKSVIYELHVKGFTAHESSGVEHRGSYRGLIEKIPYLQSLGVTSVELLPVHQFDPWEFDRVNPETGARLTNYWGYSSIGFFAPAAQYGSGNQLGDQVAEFKEMVRSMHQAGIEVILDVVYNHTGEGNEFGPTISFRGLDNSIYYMLEDDKRHYRNYSGTGNTLNCNHPVMRQLILDSLHYWVVEMHVDGFRFDLGSVLGRDRHGTMLSNPPVLERIAEDPLLRNTKLIAEAWDAGGAYQVGSFPGGRWAEWNDRYRDDVRRFWRGDRGLTAPFATRLTGSSDLYLRDGRKPFHSINFVTCHDGFTMRDLVSYRHKHNLANGERNRDGAGENQSANYGIEGPTSDQSINAIRLRQQKNFFATLLLSLGTPMVLGGDEFGRSQKGNNNAYCQDNELSWFDYGYGDTGEELRLFLSRLIEFRLHHPAFLRPEFYTGDDTDFNRMPDITWYDERGAAVDWARPGKTLALRIDGSHAEIQADQDDNDFFLIFHADGERVSVPLPPPPPGKSWYRVMDTARRAPSDFVPRGEEHAYAEQTYSCAGRSSVLFLSR
ncbi:MAG: glycogen debranching protein GlgX [Spirochaetota bacterium]